MSLVLKFRTDPALFFSESRSLSIRAVGRIFKRILIEKYFFRSFLIDPAETMAESHKVFFSFFGKQMMRYQKSRRSRTFEASQRPLISIIMAAYNAQETLESAIISVQAQTYTNWNLIIVDDASVDDTYRLCKEYSTKDSRIKVLRNTRNRGAALARNEGLNVSKGSYITFQDSDDLSHPERLERQLYGLLKRGSSVVSTCRYARVTDSSLKPVSINGKTSRKCIIAMMLNAEKVIKINGYFMDLPISEDTEYFERIKATFGKKAESHIVKVLYRARMRRDSLLFKDAELEPVGVSSFVHKKSPANRDAAYQVQQFHKRIVAGEVSPYVSMRKIEDPS